MSKDCWLTDGDVCRHLAPFLQQQTLPALKLTGNQITSHGALTLLGCGVTSLDLRFCDIDSESMFEGVREIAYVIDTEQAGCYVKVKHKQTLMMVGPDYTYKHALAALQDDDQCKNFITSRRPSSGWSSSVTVGTDGTALCAKAHVAECQVRQRMVSLSCTISTATFAERSIGNMC